MRDEFKIQRQGKTYVLFSGLLSEAHERGLQGIDTELVQVPGAENGNVAIVKAVVEMEDGRKFSGLGDASPENVGRNIVPHLLRMAETRAKARALRDAVNVGITALEELGDDEPTRTPSQPTGGRQTGAQKSVQAVDGGNQQDRSQLPATRKQLNYLEVTANDAPGGIHNVEREAGKSLSEFTRQEASDWITRLSGKAAE